MKTKVAKLNTIIFLLFSFISGFIELGGVFWAIEKGYTVVQTVVLGLAYQLGNFTPVPLRINSRIAIFLAFLSECFIGINCFYKTSYILCFISTVFLAMVIQFVRSEMKDKVSTTIKRIFRVAGFVIAPFYNMYIAFVIAIFILLIAALKKTSNQKLGLIQCKITPINKVMIIHQMHYFGYVYFMIIILVTQNQNLHSLVYGILFALGWVTYVSIPHILCGNEYMKYFIVGHTFLVSVLLIMSANYQSFLSIILWILTGFGGGTVFCIGKINSNKNICSKNDLTFSENIGHILGALGGILAYQLIGKIYAPIIFSALCAFCAIIGMVLLG